MKWTEMRAFVVVSTCLLLTTGALAQFDGPTTLNPATEFQNPDLSGTTEGIPWWLPPVHTGIGTNSITWGNPGSFGTGPSSLTFTPDGSLYSDTNRYYILGTFDYFNGTIINYYDSTDGLWYDTGISGIDLVVEPTPDPAVDMAQSTWSFPITFISTANIPGDSEASADILALPDGKGTFHVYEGWSAQVSLLVEFAPGSPYDMQIVGFVDPSEGGFIGGAVPAPGAILLGTLGTGLVGWMRRRRTL